jgi:uncharacterized phage protein gp47/JayE
MEIKTFDQARTAMRNYIVAHQDLVSDFNDGSVLESYIEAVAREFAVLYIRTQVGFSTHLRGLPYSVFNFSMKKGDKASVKLVFSRGKPQSYETPIPVGTIVSTGGVRFLTSEVGSVLTGEMQSNEITAIAEDIGEKYNVSTGAVNTLVSTLMADIVSVTNPGKATGGANSEDWGAYLDRFANYILGLQRTNGYGLLSGQTDSGLVRSLDIDEHFPPLANLWNMTVYLEDGSGGMSDETILTVKKKIDGTRTITDGGFRAPGINVRYLTPEKIPVSLHVKVWTAIDVANDIEESTVITDVQDAVQKFINGKHIGESILISDIIVLLKRITYIDDVKPVDLIDPIDPLENINISKKQITRYESCEVDVVVQE